MISVLYTTQLTKKNKTYQDGYLLIKNMKMIIYDENKKCIDSMQINQKTDYSQLQNIDFTKCQCQVDDAIINAIENVRTFKNNLFKQPSAQSKPQQQQESSSDVQEVPVTQIQQPSNKQKQNMGQNQQQQMVTDLQNDTQPDDKYANAQFNIKDISQALSKVFYSKQTCKLPDDISGLNQLKQYIISKLKLSNNVLEASIQLITSEIIIWVLTNLVSKQNILKGELLRKKFNMKFNSLNDQATQFQTTQQCKDQFILQFSKKISYQKNDLVVIFKNDYLSFFTIQNYERKDEVQFYLEPLSNCDRLCNVNFMTLTEKRQFYDNKKLKNIKNNSSTQAITQDVEYIVFQDFQNTYIQLKSILDDYLFSKNGCDRVIFDHCQRILDKKHPINTKFQTQDELDDYKGSIKSLFNARQNIVTQHIMLNSHQISALQSIKNQIYIDYEKSRVQLLRGIFGSGKSELLRELIESLYLGANNQQFKILVLSVTNIAVDNILLRLLNSGIVDKDRIQRLGTGCQIEDLQSIVASTYCESCFVTGITCASCQKLLQEDPSQFSLLIIDEASQMKLSDLVFLGLHVRVQHILLCGDPAQLPPIAEQLFNQKSVLQLFIDQGYELNNLFLQYRCVQPIAELSSQLFYEGQVESYRRGIAENVYDSVLQSIGQRPREASEDDQSELSPPQGQLMAFTQDSEETEVLSDGDSGGKTQAEPESKKLEPEPKKTRPRIKIVKRLNSDADAKPIPNLIPMVSTIQVQGAYDTVLHGSRVNVLEANTIISFITYIVDTHQILPSQIGVICPYRQQAAYLKQQLPDIITVSTVDSFQGSERDIIIVSLTKSENINDYGTNIFLNHGCRVNVAISRAKNHLVIFKSCANNIPRHVSMQYSLQVNDGYWAVILTYCQNINTMFPSFESFKEYQETKYNQYKTIYEQQGEEKLKEIIYFDFSPVCFKMQRNKELDGLKNSDKDQVNYMNYNTLKREDNPSQLLDVARQYMSLVEKYRISNLMERDGEPEPPLYNYVDRPNADRENEDGFEILAILGYQW